VVPNMVRNNNQSHCKDDISPLLLFSTKDNCGQRLIVAYKRRIEPCLNSIRSSSIQFSIRDGCRFCQRLFLVRYILILYIY